MQHLREDRQIAFKERTLGDALESIGKVAPESVLPPLAAGHWGYRRKARLGVKYVIRKGKVLVGFRERGSSFVTDLAGCAVLHPKVGRRIPELGQLIETLTIRDRVPPCVATISISVIQISRWPPKSMWRSSTASGRRSSVTTAKERQPC